MKPEDILKGNAKHKLPPEIKLVGKVSIPEDLGRFAWSPDGHLLAIPTPAGIKLWCPGGLETIASTNRSPVHGLAWSPDGAYIATAAADSTIGVWDLVRRSLSSVLTGHNASVLSVDWSTVGPSLLASGASDSLVKIWDVLKQECITTLRGHSAAVPCVAWSPDKRRLASCGRDGKLIVWDADSEERVISTSIAGGALYSVCWSPRGESLALACEDSTIRVIDASSGRQTGVLEGHILSVTSVCFNGTGTLLASKAMDESTILWRWDTWEAVAVIREPHYRYAPTGLALSKNPPLLVTVAPKTHSLKIWSIDVPNLLERPSQQKAVYYTNAKVVLVGETGVGKTALGIVLSGQQFIPTESTHGRHVWTFEHTAGRNGAGRQESRETILWDLAGQPGYRLIHQLSFNEISVALVVFDARSDADPLSSVRHWARALSQARRAQGDSVVPMKMLLVQARVDRGTAAVSKHRIASLMQAFGFDDYFPISSKEGNNIRELADAIRKSIDWNSLPKVSSSELFHAIKLFIISEKKLGTLLVTGTDLFRNYTRCTSTTERADDLQAQFNACVSLVESRGLIRRLGFAGLVLLQPELLDSYGAALLNAAANDEDGLGSIREDIAKAGAYPIPADERVKEPQQERLLLLATIEELLRQEIALREPAQDGPFLVFPSQFMREWPDRAEPSGRTVIFEFEGPILNLYSTLAVRLSHSGTFAKKEMWQKAAVFRAASGSDCGIKLREIEDGHAELTLFFSDDATEEAKFQFEEYVFSHLRKRALDGSLRRRRVFTCPDCRIEVSPEQVLAIREKGLNWVRCNVCGNRFSILDREARLVASGSDQISIMDATADARRDRDASEIAAQGRVAAGEYDVFLCHNNEDKPAIRAIADRLHEDQIIPWLDERELRPGLPWQRALEHAIEKIQAAAVFVGRSGLGPWQQQEVEAILSEFVRRGRPVIPVILEDCSEEPLLPLFLRNMTWVDFRPPSETEETGRRKKKRLAAPNPYNLLRWGITGDKN